MCVGVYVINGHPIDLWVMLLAELAYLIRNHLHDIALADYAAL